MEGITFGDDVSYLSDTYEVPDHFYVSFYIHNLHSLDNDFAHGGHRLREVKQD